MDWPCNCRNRICQPEGQWRFLCLEIVWNCLVIWWYSTLPFTMGKGRHHDAWLWIYGTLSLYMYRRKQNPFQDQKGPKNSRSPDIQMPSRSSKASAQSLNDVHPDKEWHGRSLAQSSLMTPVFRYGSCGCANVHNFNCWCLLVLKLVLCRWDVDAGLLTYLDIILAYDIPIPPRELASKSDACWAPML